MADYSNREAFIPYRRNDLIELCIEDGGLAPADIRAFRAFCELLSAYYHFKAHRTLERLKDNYVPFNPDADTRPRAALSTEQKKGMEQQLADAFEAVLGRANYTKLNQDDIDAALKLEALIPLRTKIDFNDFEQLICYYRGSEQRTLSYKKFFRQKHYEFENLERVALLLKYKDEDYFQQQRRPIDKLGFTPGKLYLYLYKNIPRADLELLFPNVKVSMNLKDILLLSVPALGAAIPLVLKILPSLGLILGAIAVVTLGPDIASKLNIDPNSKQAVLTVLVAVLSAGAALGGYAAKQYTKYKAKCLEFSKKVSDTLFFNNLVSNRGVLHTLVDSAEEEETKEIILIYYHLLSAGKALSRDELDNRIERWMEQQFQAKIDFNIDKALQNLTELHGAIDNSSSGLVPKVKEPLLSFDSEGNLQVLPLMQAGAVIDDVWDRIFQYDHGASEVGTEVEKELPMASVGT